jgi:hypothetical protein
MNDVMTLNDVCFLGGRLMMIVAVASDTLNLAWVFAWMMVIQDKLLNDGCDRISKQHR